jgi:hypothetical protein
MEAWGKMTLRRRAVLKLGGLGLAGAGLAPRWLLSSLTTASTSASPLRDLWLNENYPFPYDDKYFDCAERIYNVRPAGGGTPGYRADLGLVVKPGRRLDIRIAAADTLSGLSSAKDVWTFYGVDDVLDMELAAGDSPRLFYQVFYREGTENWRSLAPKSFKLPAVGLDQDGEIKVILISDDHTFDDADYSVADNLRGAKLNGDYVNELLKELRFDPHAKIQSPFGVLKNGLCLAQALRYVMINEDPDIVINLGDTSGIGASYKWDRLGLPTVGLTDKEYDYISHTLWLRMRKMYSALTPYVPMFIAQGNHDGEEQWTPARVRAAQWRKKLFPMPDDQTYPEGGHPDGLYYAFSWGSDRNYRGGARFIILHTTAFAGERYPQTVDKWTLGEAQRQWYEGTLKMGEKDWVFTCLHHVLGGWPSGSSEQDIDYCYGRGPLFTFDDYLGYADPTRVEQVQLTELGHEHGLRAFLYGHDHIFHSKTIAADPPGKDMLGVCCGSTKYMGEAGWWKGAYWHRHYGFSNPPAPQFWGPPGITKLTIRKKEAIVEYIVTGYSLYTNLPEDAMIGRVLETRRLVNPPPALLMDRQELVFEAAEGRRAVPSQVLRIKNAGGGALLYKLKADPRWIYISPESGQSWGEWDEIKVFVSASKMSQGTYEGKITVESNDPANARMEVKVKLTIGHPVPYPPRDFRGSKKEGSAASPAEVDIVLSWGSNPLNGLIRWYRIYGVDGRAGLQFLGEVDGRTFTYLVRNVDRNKSYLFAASSVDSQGREGQKAYTTVL